MLEGSGHWVALQTKTTVLVLSSCGEMFTYSLQFEAFLLSGLKVCKKLKLQTDFFYKQHVRGGNLLCEIAL